MTKETAKQFIDVLQAFVDGRPVEVKTQFGWEEIKNPNFGSSPENYRVKPEPREWFINIYENRACGLYHSKMAADNNAVVGRVECVRVREIL